MNTQDERTIRVIGEEGFTKLQDKHVLVFGLGGVGGYVCEGLVRAGIKHLSIVDNDEVQESNLNRQIIALHSTIGQKKVDVITQRMMDIRPDVSITAYDLFYLPETFSLDIFEKVDYIIDAIDTMTAKIDLVLKAQELHIPIISCMGTGNKLHPELLEITDVYKTEMCPVCKVMRRELKKRHIKHLKVVYSKEQPVKTNTRTPGSVSFVPSVAGLLIASEVINDFLKEEN